MMKKQVFTAIAICSLLKVFSQDAHFSQYHHSRIYANPAFSGSDSVLLVSGAYRVQWPKTSAYRSAIVSADRYFHKLRSGIGLSYLNDNMMDGAYKKQRLELNLAPHFELFRHRLVIRPAVQIAYQRNQADLSQLTFGGMIDPRRGFVYSSNEPPKTAIAFADLSAGLLLYTNTFFGGIAVHHITQPDEGLAGKSRLPLKTTAHAGANLKLPIGTSSFILSPSVLYMQQHDFRMILPGVAAKYKMISAAISYRSEDAFIATLAFHNRCLRLGYSYDYTISKLENSMTGGAHEIGLTGFINGRKKHAAIKTLRLI